jgi:hypothetical protein
MISDRFQLQLLDQQLDNVFFFTDKFFRNELEFFNTC